MSAISRTLFTALVATLMPTLPSIYIDPIQDAQWHLKFLNVADAHRYTQGEGITVAVVDTGIDAKHPDLAGNVIPGADFSTRGPGDGLTDQDGHGTSVAGLIAAHGKALGIAPRARVQSVRIVTTGIGASSAPGIDWSVSHGATVLSIASVEEDNPHLREAIRKALAANIVVVAGVGNRPKSDRVGFPAAYPGVVAAAGVGRDGNHAEISVTGPETVLAAPAVDIASTDRLGEGSTGYSVASGTSAATGIIAGAAALVRARFPNLSAAEVVHRLTATADDKGPPGRDDEYGYGVVNLVKALTADVPPLQPTASPTQAAAHEPQQQDRGFPTVPVVVGILVLVLLTGSFVAWRQRTPAVNRPRR